MEDWIRVLIKATQQPIVNHEVNQALKAFDQFITEISAFLQVEYVGTEVGVGQGKRVYRLVIRSHEWEQIGQFHWSLKVCDALDNNHLRAAWGIDGVSRLRKLEILRCLAEFLLGYQEAVAQANKLNTPYGKQLSEMVGYFIKS